MSIIKAIGLFFFIVFAVLFANYDSPVILKQILACLVGLILALYSLWSTGWIDND